MLDFLPVLADGAVKPMLGPGSPLRSPLRVALVYALFGALWILFSDRLATLLFPDPEALRAAQTAKGLFFVFCSALLIFALVRYELRGRARVQRALEASRARLEATLEELRHRDSYLSALLDSVSDIIAVIDAEGRVHFHTPSAERILGYSASEIAALDIRELVHPEDALRERRKLAQMVEGARSAPTVLSLRARRKDGSWRNFEVVGTQLASPAAEQDDRVIITARDITERMRTEKALAESEAQLRHAQKMEAVGRLAGGVAHDFNNIVTAIFGYAEVLADGLQDRPDVQADLAEIGAAAQRARTLTRQLLTFSRQEVHHPEAVDVGEHVRSLDKLLRRLIGEDVRLVTDVEVGLEPVLIDPGQLEQIVLNLAVNARDAMPRGGDLTIRVTPAPLSDGAVPAVRLEVDDTGVGMSEDTVAHIFEPFFTTKPSTLGTGLGLSIVYGIVAQGGGRIDVRSAPGQGTTFVIDLPAAPPERPRPHPLSPPGGRLEDFRGQGTILIVEDEEGVRRLCRRLLRRLGYTVLEASDGDEALALCDQHGQTLDLVLTDVVVPKLGGSLLIDSLRERCPSSAILVMSGYTDDTVVRHGIERGAYRFLAKPFSPLTLAQSVAEALSERPAAT